MIDSNRNFTDKEFAQEFNKIWTYGVAALKPAVHPKAFVLGGPPGAGKGGLTEFLKNTEFANNVLIINGDDYREFHPKFEQINNEFKEEGSKHTQIWAGQMVGALVEKSKKAGFNIIVEGTFRTSEAPIRTLETYKEQGFDVNVAIMLTDAVTAWKSTESRYKKALLAGEPARAVPKEHFETVIMNLSETIPEVFSRGIVNDFLVFNRESIAKEKTIFDGKQSDVSKLSQVVKSELNLQRYFKLEIMAEVQKVMPLNEQQKHDLGVMIDKQLAMAAQGGKTLNVKKVKENIREGLSRIEKTPKREKKSGRER